MEEPGQGGAQFLTDSFIDADTCEVIQPAGGRPDGYYTAFGNWYDYNPNGNIVSAPENVVFYMYDFSAGHQRYKIQIVDYTAGVYQIAFGVF